MPGNKRPVNHEKVTLCPFCNTMKWPSHQVKCPERPYGPGGSLPTEPQMGAVTEVQGLSGGEVFGPDTRASGRPNR